MTYWPWWTGALALGAVGLLYFLLLGRLLGVSGSWAKVVFWREQQKLARQNKSLREANPQQVNQALLAETLAEFGEAALTSVQEQNFAPHQCAHDTPDIKETSPVSHLVFLVSLFIGALLYSVATGHFQFRYDLSAIHTQIFGSTSGVWLALFLGGAMVGFGTQMAGGCTSGHGLSGCARLMPASLLSTSIFIASAVTLALLMKAYIS